MDGRRQPVVAGDRLRDRGGAQGAAGDVSAHRRRAQLRPRALPFVLVGAFAALLVGGIALSLSSAPARRRAAAPRRGAGHHVGVGLRARRHQLGQRARAVAPVAEHRQPTGTVVFHVLYQAPDAVQETEVEPERGRPPSVILIGDRRFRQTGSQWIELPAERRSRGAGRRRRSWPRCEGRPTPPHVTRHGRRLPLRAHRSGPAPDHGPRRATRPQLSSPRLTAVVRGGTLTHETITAVVGQPAPRGGPGLLRRRLGAPGDRAPGPPWRRPGDDASRALRAASPRGRPGARGREAREAGRGPGRAVGPRGGWVASGETGFTFEEGT